MKTIIIILVGVLLGLAPWLVRDIQVARKTVQSRVIFLTVQQECTARVGEVWAASSKGVKPRLDLSLALALCKEGDTTATRVLVTLNKERPRYRDGRMK